MSRARRIVAALVCAAMLALAGPASPAAADEICIDFGIGPIGGEFCVPAP